MISIPAYLARALACVALGFTLAGTAHAEGGCPDGTFPIGGGNAGWQGCAPMGGNYDDEEYDDYEEEPEDHAQHWWGSMATGVKAFGAAEGQMSQGIAEAMALEQCEKSAPNASCQIAVTYYDQCAAIAWGEQGSTAYRGPDEEEDKRQAMAACNAQNFTDCEIYYSACSLQQSRP